MIQSNERAVPPNTPVDSVGTTARHRGAVVISLNSLSRYMTLDSCYAELIIRTAHGLGRARSVLPSLKSCIKRIVNTQRQAAVRKELGLNDRAVLSASTITGSYDIRALARPERMDEGSADCSVCKHR